MKTAGWSEIVGVGSPTVNNRQSGVQVSDSTGSLGQFRYLLFSHSPNVPGSNSSPIIREIDVYAGGAQVGTDIAITNHSFETLVSGGAVAGWTRSGGTSIFSEGSNNVNLPYPEGISSLGIRANTVGVPITLEQTLGEVTGYGEYTLSFFVADRIAEKWLNYQVELFSGTDILISANSATNSAIRPFNGSTDFASDVLFGSEGDWLNVVLTGSTTPSMIGQALTIRFTSTSQSNDNGSHNDFALDNVQLSFVQIVPEPSSAILTALGLAGPGLMVYRSCKRRRRV